MAYSNSWVNTTPASPIVVTVAPTAGDVLVAWFLTDNQNGSATLTLPSGFTQVGSAQVCTYDNQTLWVAIKNNASGSETTLSFNNSDGASMIAGVAAFNGRDNTTPQDVAAVQVNINTASTNTPTASITPVTNGVDIIAINGADVNSSGANPTFTFTTTAGTTGAWTTRQDQKNGFFNAGVGTAAQVTAGAVTITCTRSVSSGNSMTVLALRPSSGGGAFTLTADAGSYTTTGTAATLRVARKLAADSGSYTISGTAATLKKGFRLNADGGAYAISGSDAALRAARRIIPDAGSYAISGTDATLRAARKLSAEAGSYVINGSSATLIYSGAGGGGVVAYMKPWRILY